MNFFGLTDIGRTRKQNQDSIFICDDFENVKYFIIADGMGGVNGRRDCKYDGNKCDKVLYR